MTDFSLLPKLFLKHLGALAIAPIAFAVATVILGFVGASPTQFSTAQAQLGQPGLPGRPLTLRSDVQEANSKTGVITARGNVQIYYPARQIQATAAQAQYFSRERRIVLSGNVYVLQQGNSLRGETVTYLIDEGRFVALPQSPKQVEAIYQVQDNPTPSPSPAASSPVPVAPPANPFERSEFGAPTSP